jgi:hypothetical protein
LTGRFNLLFPWQIEFVAFKYNQSRQAIAKSVVTTNLVAGTKLAFIIV